MQGFKGLEHSRAAPALLRENGAVRTGTLDMETLDPLQEHGKARVRQWNHWKFILLSPKAR